MLCILLPSKTVQRIRSKNKLPRSIYIRGYSPLCSYLKTKESYDRWITKRVWGFRQQISKAKYLKMSVAHIGKLHKNIAALCKMAAKLSG